MGSIIQSVGTRRWTSQAPSNSRQKQCKRCRAPPLFLDGSTRCQIDPHPLQIAAGQRHRGAVGEIDSNRMSGPLSDPERAASAARADGICHLLQPLASAPLARATGAVRPGASLVRFKPERSPCYNATRARRAASRVRSCRLTCGFSFCALHYRSAMKVIGNAAIRRAVGGSTIELKTLDLPRFGGELVAHARPAISNWTGLW